MSSKRRTNGQMAAICCGFVLATTMIIVGLAGSAGAALGGVLGATMTPPGNLLFRDDFSTYSQRWAERETHKAAAFYTESTFDMHVIAPGVSVWSVPELDIALSTYVAQVDVVVHESGADARFGFVIDYRGERDFCAITVRVDGIWQFGCRTDGEWMDLTPAEIDPVVFPPVDESALVPVRLTMKVMDGAVTLWVDEQIAGTIPVAEAWSGGVFGLIAVSEKSFIMVSFDDMVVWHDRGDGAPLEVTRIP